MGIKNGPVILIRGDFGSTMNDQNAFQKLWITEITL